MDKKNNITTGRAAWRIAQNTGLFLMVLLVIGLTAAVIALLTANAAFEEEVPFRMEQLTASEGPEQEDIDRHFLPAFIGISVKGERRGVSAGHNVVHDVYRVFAPVLADVLGGDGLAVPSEYFTLAAEESAFVYLRYHSSIPCRVIHACAGGTDGGGESAVNVYDMLILPDKGFRILVRDAEGSVYSFQETYESYFTVDTLWELLQAYQRNFADFVFTDDMGEPQFTERIRTKNMLVTEKTATLIQEKSGHIAEILRLMEFNPDKLYSYDESGIGYVYVENHGVLRFLEDAIEYTAASADGGISLDAFVGQRDGAQYTLADHIGTACLIADRVKSLSAHYAGGDGELLLDSAVTDAGGSLTLRFIYTFDNLRLAGCAPALRVSFLDGRLISLRLYTVSMRNLGSQNVSLLESWYYETAVDRCTAEKYIVDTRQVYQTDFYAESISATWSVVLAEKGLLPNRTRG